MSSRNLNKLAGCRWIYYVIAHIGGTRDIKLQKPSITLYHYLRLHLHYSYGDSERPQSW